LTPTVTVTLSSTFRRFITSFKSAPLHFLLLQIPGASTDLFETWLLPDGKENSPGTIVLVLFFFLYVLIASGISSALTFASIRQMHGGQRPNFRVSLTEVIKKLNLVIPASILVGVVCTLGIISLVLPGAYLMAIYLFVPQIIMDEDGVPLMACLNRSTKLARPALKTCFTVVIGILGTLVISYMVGENISTLISNLQMDPNVKILLAGLVKMLFSLLLGMIIDVFVSEFYYSLKETGGAL
jgi:hypothetical protein